jgi:formylglycine-generating enzyme required for sulfatase activity
MPAQLDEYRLVRPLGRAAGSWLAHDRLLDRAVVLHVLVPGDAQSRSLLAGARALARVSNPSVCCVHRVRNDAARPYVVSDYARGPTLDTIAVPLPSSRVVEIGRALAGAVVGLHAAGVIHGDVRAARVAIAPDGAVCLFGLERASGDADAAARAADVRALGALLDAIAPADLRAHLTECLAGCGPAPTGEQLLGVLDVLARPTVAMSVSDNPYRGLRPFEAEHAPTFFGRRAETAELVARLRGQPWVLVAGRSGAGKSSLVGAGVVPAITSGALGERERWEVVTVKPGNRPAEALSRALAASFSRDEEELHALLASHPALGGRLARKRTDAGTLLVVDQLEELFTVADPSERRRFFDVLASFGALAPGVRAVLTIRSDFLDRLSDLGALGRDLLRAAVVVPPPRGDALREAIASPARARGFDVEPAVVDALVEEAVGRPEALPLLSFALAELWQRRDRERHVIPEAALRRMGSAAAALARHGDLVLAALSVDERREARRIMLSLVDASPVGGTRVRRTRARLVEGSATAEAALDALVTGRLVVAGDAYEVAHEALVTEWPRLRAWLDEASEAKAAGARLTEAAREWERIGRREEGLWSTRQLRDLDVPGVLEGSRDSESVRAFAEASRRSSRRARTRRRALQLGIPVVVAAAAATAWTTLTLRQHGEVARVVAEARVLDARAEETARAADDMRARAVALFDRDDPEPAEESWRHFLERESAVDAQRRDVCSVLDRALALDPRDGPARVLYGDVIALRLAAAQRRHADVLVPALFARLGAFDDGTRERRLRAPARVRVETDPPGVSVALWRYQDSGNGRLAAMDSGVLEPGVARELEAGSYLAAAASPDRVVTRVPFTIDPGEERGLRVVLPRTEDVPEGMLYVPAGRFLYGSGDDEATRAWLTHVPMHPLDLPAFLVARTETTYAEYLAFLVALPEGERKTRTPDTLSFDDSARSPERAGARLQIGDLAVREGQPYCPHGRPCVDWLRLPVVSVSRDDGVAYAAWVARTRVGLAARLCTDREWERAARGADGRRYPWGDAEPEPADACALASDAGEQQPSIPCEVGTHPAGRSPSGADDMTGNVWEWTASTPDVAHPGMGIVRGGGYADHGLYLAVANRGLFSHNLRARRYGLRLCADAR